MPSKPEVLKARRANDPEYAERIRSYGRKWREANLEKARQLDIAKAAGKRSKDRDAYNAYMREWTERNKERLNQERRERRKSDPEYQKKVRESDLRRYWKDPLKHKDVRLKGTYGIGINEFNKMREIQDSRCAICGIHEKSSAKGLAVDHCHAKGNVRGLLCNNCNNGLGRFKDDVSLLQKAIEYLNKFKE